MAKQFAGIDIEIIKSYQESWSYDVSTLQISDFPIYGSRLESINQRMASWRPSHPFDLRHLPYRDTVPYYAFWFAMLFSILGMASLGLNILQSLQKPSSLVETLVYMQ